MNIVYYSEFFNPRALKDNYKLYWSRDCCRV